MIKNIQEILKELTLEEKAALCTGKGPWHLKGIERLGIPSIMVTDGPHGLRKQTGAGDHAGLNHAEKATCFPTASGLAASWNPQLIEQMGVALGKECRAEQVSVLLGPGVNIKRHPLGGRNFEYFSEDPLLAGCMSSAWIKGVQSQNVGTSLKHYAVNNHEHCRMTVDAIVDQRTLREIYLPAFEHAVTQAQPWTVMSAYNKVNGVYASEHKQLLDDILVKEWGFKGIVVTDWGANNDRIEGLKNGQHLDMPDSGALNSNKIIAAVNNGQLSMQALDKSVGRLLELILKSQAVLEDSKVEVDLNDHHQLAAAVAQESCVLLKNEDFLPVSKGQKIAVIGALANSTRYQGAGSSKINPFKLEQPLEEIKKVFGSDNVNYTPGYHLDDQEDGAEQNAAIQLASQADVVFLFLGLTPKYESEGFDRQHLNLPQVQLDLVAALQGQLKKTVVILQNGAPLALPFVGQVPAILEAYLGGQAGASAVAKALSGDINPSGKLAESFPLHLDDVASTPYFPGSKQQVQYREAIWVGYRYFDTANQAVLFPFGHGLSYTSFQYSNPRLSGEALNGNAFELTPNDVLTVTMTVTNTGKMAGAEVVQCYVGQTAPSQPRPHKELKAFAKVFLEPGESKDVILSLGFRAFAYWCTEKQTWLAQSDTYKIHLGASVADIRATLPLDVVTQTALQPKASSLAPYFDPAQRDFNDSAFAALLGYEIPKPTPIRPFHLNSTVGDIAQTTLGKPIFDNLLAMFTDMMSGDSNETSAQADRLMAESMTIDMPLRNLAVFNSDQYSEQQVKTLIDELNRTPDE